ncbi:hypothetical protein GQ457_08G027300 [Hibiscus cannabinus]
MVKRTKNMLNSRFDMKDMGLADTILGIQIKRSPEEALFSVIVKGSSKVRDLVSSAAVEDHPLLYPGRPTTLDLKHRGAVESVLRKLQLTLFCPTCTTSGDRLFSREERESEVANDDFQG